jgi:hypothetical protein
LANGVVRLFANGVEVGFDQTNIFPFTYSITSSALSDGNKAMTTRFEDLAGNESSGVRRWVCGSTRWRRRSTAPFSVS